MAPFPCILLVAAALSLPSHSITAADLAATLATNRTNDLARHIRVLASDEFEGREPGSPGEERTVRYLVGHFQRLGLQPGGADGSWFQDVPLVGVQSEVQASVSIKGKEENWQFPQDFVAWSPWVQEKVEVGPSELVFVGYGVVAPEYDWDDFKGVDVRGKTLLMLVNDPPVPDPNQPGSLDDRMFRGKAMTYYGRWTYKFEIAAARGAAAAMVIHETGPAGYPYFVVINSWGRENFELQSPDKNTNRLAVASWMSLDRTRTLLKDTGHDFEDLKRKALQRDFQPVPLGAFVRFGVTNKTREVRSRNVLAKLPGAHPERKQECVIYTAHWDHLGRDSRLTGDQIFNGAVDNASGTAALLELAEAFTALPQKPDRTILFLSVTAEEQGLLGARYYAHHPVYPLNKTLANINIDVINVVGPTGDIGVVGHGLNTLEDLLAAAAHSQNRTLRNEAEPEKGKYYRSDHFEFAKVGVPALYLDAVSDEIVGRPPGYGRQRRDEYRDTDYHKVTDQMHSWWDLSGAVQDLQLLFQVGYNVAQGSQWPEWKPGAEFKERRDASLR